MGLALILGHSSLSLGGKIMGQKPGDPAAPATPAAPANPADPAAPPVEADKLQEPTQTVEELAFYAPNYKCLTILAIILFLPLGLLALFFSHQVK